MGYLFAQLKLVRKSRFMTLKYKFNQLQHITTILEEGFYKLIPDFYFDKFYKLYFQLEMKDTVISEKNDGYKLKTT